MSATTGLLSILSGALRGRQDRRFREAEEERFAAEQERADLFDRLRLTSTPGVVLDGAEAPPPDPSLAAPGPGELANGTSTIPENIPGEISEAPSQPLLDRMNSVIDIGDVSLGGEDLSVSFDPNQTLAAMRRAQETAGREQETENQRQAFEQLPPAEFGEFNPGIDYIKEFQSFRDRERKAVADEERGAREAENLEEFVALTQRVNPGMSRHEAELLAQGGRRREGEESDEPARLSNAQREISQIRRIALSRGRMGDAERSDMIEAQDDAARLYGFGSAAVVEEKSKGQGRPPTIMDDSSLLGRQRQSIREHPNVTQEILLDVDTILGMNNADPRDKFAALEIILDELEGAVDATP